MNTDEIICSEDLENLKKYGCDKIEIRCLERFAKPFHRTGRLYLARIFIRARIAKKDFWKVIVVCGDLYDEVWSKGTPGKIGDPDDVAVFEPLGESLSRIKSTHGWWNVCAYYQAYKNLGFPLPNSLT